MTKYSISRLNTYRDCPLRYKFQYIDGITVPYKHNDSTFLGSMCHRSLEKLYRDRMEGKIDSEEDFLDYYNGLWEQEYSPEKVIRLSEQYGPDYYRLQGVDMLSRYYRNIFAADDMDILGLETEELLDLPNGDTYHIKIDKLAHRDGTFYVCDYKTDRKEKEQAVADSDRQLAMYALWVKRKFPSAKDVKLLWHMLRFDGEQATVTSTRTAEELDALEKETVEFIKEIESATEFPMGKNPFCDGCKYHHICPKFAPPKVLTIEDGVKLVDELVEKSSEKSLLQNRIDEIKSELVKLAETDGYEAIAGTAYEVPVKRSLAADNEHSDWEAFTAKAKELGVLDGYLELNKKKISSEINSGDLNPELVKCLDIQKTVSAGRQRKRKNTEEE